MRRLEIGCGHRKGHNAIGIDIDKNSDADVVCDINHGIPFKNNSFDRIFMRSILEHVDAYNAMKEVHRICKNGATVEIWMPHFSSHQAWMHLQHKRGGSYFMFISHKPEEYGFRFDVIEARILIEGREYPYSKAKSRWHYVFTPIEWLANRFPMSFERLWCYWVGGAEALYFKLKAVK
jgi:SAM-dependent methyltransferase